MRTTTEKRLRERIANLEAMVAMAEPPSMDKWPFFVIIPWREEQKKIKERLDRQAARMKEARK